MPRERDSSFDPKIVANRQRRLTGVDGVDDMVISQSGTFWGRLRRRGADPHRSTAVTSAADAPGAGRGRRTEPPHALARVPWPLTEALGHARRNALRRRGTRRLFRAFMRLRAAPADSSSLPSRLTLTG